ncbi:unnamed protein product [Brassica oleracea var. botrytis]|uniref:Cell wall hydroxyproline-rich glycoprotein n=1 Tax=Brassica napus TaxID=3708 RepID=A0A816U313_BRANA|nr:unnamed protein product [Brassica napus]
MKKTIQIILLLLLLNLSRSLSISSHGTLSDSEVRHIQRRQLLEFAERSQNVIVDPSLVFENPRLRNAYIALQAWKQAIFSDPFNFTANWIGSNVCNYTGVFCSPALDNRRIPTVAGINLNHADIAGYLPEELEERSAEKKKRKNKETKSETKEEKRAEKDEKILPEEKNTTSVALPCIDKLRDELSCAICLEICYEPSTTTCGHRLYTTTKPLTAQTTIGPLALFHVNSNWFCGTVPHRFNRLKLLFELDLSNNRFAGKFPAVVLRLPSLKCLDLRFNAFEGTVPKELFSKDLDAIFINHNRFRFELPDNFGDSPVSVIVLANNRFHGCIPSSKVEMKNLNEIIFTNNGLSSCLPADIGRLKNVTVFDVSFNELVGALPESVGEMVSVEQLNVAHNKLSGKIPTSIC